MPKEWTKKERKEHLDDKYRSNRSKIFVLVTAAAVFMLLLWGVFHAIKMGDSELLSILVLAMIVYLPFSIFMIDMFWFEFQ